MTDLADLIARVEALTGPDRRVDSAVDAALRAGNPGMDAWVWDNFPVWRESPIYGACQVVNADGHGGAYWQSAPFTASLDAAVALVEKKLPGQLWHIMKAALRAWSLADGKPADLARYVVLALLKSLQGGKDG